MSTVSPSRLSPLAELFLQNFQYTLGLLNRPFIDENTFNRSVRNLHGSLATLLVSRSEICLHVRNGRVCLDDLVLPDSYQLQKVFVRNRCPAVLFQKGIPLLDLLNCVKEMGSLLKQELDPEVMVSVPKQDVHYRWIPMESVPSGGTPRPVETITA